MRNDSIFVKILEPDGSFNTFLIFGGDERLKPYFPLVNRSYVPPLKGSSYLLFPVKDYHENLTRVYVSLFDAEQYQNEIKREFLFDREINSISMAITPADFIHIVYESDGEIFYRVSINKIIDPTDEIIWSEEVNLSRSPNIISKNPVIECYGENVIVAWSEGERGEILVRKRKVYSDYDNWSEIKNISRSPDRNSDYPFISTPYCIGWQEEMDSENYDILAYVNRNIINISENDTKSQFPQILSEEQTAYYDTANKIIIDPTIIINAVWIEEIIPEKFYEISFKRKEIDLHSLIEYIDAKIGDTLSPYCENREGIIIYEEIKCDFNDSTLIYKLPYLDPKGEYVLQVIVYKEGNTAWREEIYVDSEFVGEVVYRPYVPETIRIFLPKEFYLDDLTIKKEIEKIVGSYATIADLKIYKVNKKENFGYGVQSLLNNKINRPILHQNRPNPFKKFTKISFIIPKEEEVSLTIYDISGRKVKTLISDKLKAGNYYLKWDGKDEKGKEVECGIYFYCLKTKNFKDTKKMVFTK